jgi:hypothetical protein
LPSASAGSAEVEHPQLEEAAPARPQHHGDRTADHAAEPDQARPAEQAADQVVGDAVPVLEHVVDPRADEAADQRRERHLVRPVARLADLLQPPRDHRPRGQEAEREADPEGLQRQRAEVDLREHGQQTN